MASTAPSNEEKKDFSDSFSMASASTDQNHSHVNPLPPTFALHIPSLGDNTLNTKPGVYHSNGNPGAVAHPGQQHPDLHVRTDVVSMTPPNSISIPRTRPSVHPMSRSNSYQGSHSPASSSIGSPMLSALIGDITPLPSPIISGDSPPPWKYLHRSTSGASRPASRGSLFKESTSTGEDNHNQHHQTLSPSSSSTLSPDSSKKKIYFNQEHSGNTNDMFSHHHGSVGPPSYNNRSVSEQIPNTSSTNTNIHLSHTTGPPLYSYFEKMNDTSSKTGESVVQETRGLKREEYLAEKRGIVSAVDGAKQDINENAMKSYITSMHDAMKNSNLEGPSYIDAEIKSLKLEKFSTITVPGNNHSTWRGLKRIGQGTFSTVILATSQKSKTAKRIEDFDRDKLVAVKVVEHGAAGGASRSRIESSLKREVDIMKSMKHPSLVHLKAFSVEESRTLLVLTYCSGGDLFDFASEQMKNLTPKLVQRMFAELVGALMYLHNEGIVHRDVKLENVLVNISIDEVLALPDPLSYHRSLTTLTDLGLSRRIVPENPLLTTRCGSEDYAAPEILLSQPYDGRQTDAWALGVLLYGIIESRLPFDPMPGTNEHKMRSRTAHRICRCDWKWVKLADNPPPLNEVSVEGATSAKTNDPAWDPAKLIVDGLLRRVKKRVSLAEIADMEWVKGGILNGLEDPPDAEDIAEEEH